MTFYPKWMYKNKITARLYDHHPDTGDTNYNSAYVYSLIPMTRRK